MFADADHEVIDSPEALFRHLYEDHDVEEARDLDPDTAPVQFWLRRHSELERAQRTAYRDPEPPQRPPAPQPQRRPQPEPRPQPEARPGRVRQDLEAASREGRRPAGFGDPLVEAVARALAGRGHDEAAVRAAIRSFAGANGTTSGEAGVRALFVEPMLESVAEQLLGAAGPPRPSTRPQPAGPTGASADPEPVARPEAAWAVLWADLGEAGKRTAAGTGAEAVDGDDLMAVADAVQQRRRVRLLRR